MYTECELYFERLGMRRFWSLAEWVRSLRGSGGGAALNHRLIECDPCGAQNQNHATWNLPRQPQCLISDRSK